MKFKIGDPVFIDYGYIKYNYGIIDEIIVHYSKRFIYKIKLSTSLESISTFENYVFLDLKQKNINKIKDWLNEV